MKNITAFIIAFFIIALLLVIPKTVYADTYDNINKLKVYYLNREISDGTIIEYKDKAEILIHCEDEIYVSQNNYPGMPALKFLQNKDPNWSKIVLENGNGGSFRVYNKQGTESIFFTVYCSSQIKSAYYKTSYFLIEAINGNSSIPKYAIEFDNSRFKTGINMWELKRKYPTIDWDNTNNTITGTGVCEVFLDNSSKGFFRFKDLKQCIINDDGTVSVFSTGKTLADFKWQRDQLLDMKEKATWIKTFKTQETLLKPEPKKTTKSISERGLKLFEINNRTLFEKRVGFDVFKLKYVLDSIGYLKSDKSYIFTQSVTEAVKSLQKDFGIAPDGIVGPATYKILNKIIDKYNIYLPSLEIKFPSDVPIKNWILVNKSQNTLYYMNKKDIISTYPVATGVSENLTPEGKFTIVVKQINPIWGGDGYAKPIPGGDPTNPLGNRWMGLSIKGGGQFGIHGNVDPKSIGTYASHGCVRMNNEDVEYLYDLIPLGTPVWIGTELKLASFGILFNIKW